MQANSNAHDFGAYTISAAETAEVLHRSKPTIYTALKTLKRAQLITQEDNTFTLQAHSATEFREAQGRINRPANAKPFTAEAQARCRQAYQKSKAVPTGITDKKSKTVSTPPLGGADMTPKKVSGGPDNPHPAVPTQTNNSNHNNNPEPLSNHTGQMQEQRKVSVENSALHADLDALCDSLDRDPTSTEYYRRIQIAQWIQAQDRHTREHTENRRRADRPRTASRTV